MPKVQRLLSGTAFTRQRDHLKHDLLDAPSSGIDICGVVRDPKRSRGATRILRIPSGQLSAHRRQRYPRGLCVASARALVQRSVKVNLQLRLWQHHSSDVSPIHDHAAARPKVTLGLQQRRAYIGMNSDRAGSATDDLATDIFRLVLPINGHVEGAIAPIEAEAQRSSHPASGIGIGRVFTCAKQAKADAPIQRTGIDIQVCEPGSDEAGDRTLAGGSRTVNGDSDTHGACYPSRTPSANSGAVRSPAIRRLQRFHERASPWI